jgi:hypothetical protein
MLLNSREFNVFVVNIFKNTCFEDSMSDLASRYQTQIYLSTIADSNLRRQFFLNGHGTLYIISEFCEEHTHKEYVIMSLSNFLTDNVLVRKDDGLLSRELSGHVSELQRHLAFEQGGNRVSDLGELSRIYGRGRTSTV